MAICLGREAEGKDPVLVLRVDAAAVILEGSQ